MAETKTIITIGRQFGSAGREIGYKVADRLGIKLYDKEILSKVSEESGIISVARAGKITRYADSETLKRTLGRYYWQELESARK